MMPSTALNRHDSRGGPLIAVAAVYGAVVLQGWLLHRVGVSLDLVVIAVFATAIRTSEMPALALGAGGGLLVDMARGGLLGPSVMALGTVGYLAAASARWFYRVSGVLSLMLVFFLSLVAGLVEGLVLQAFLEYPLTGEWLSWTVIRSLLTAAFWVPGAVVWSSGNRSSE